MTALPIVAAGLAFLVLASAAFAVAGRVLHPFELEWMEGAMVIHVARLVQGQDIYVRPSLEFVPFGYPALYYYLCLPLAWALGSGFAALRVISIAATMMSLVLVHLIVKRESGGTAGMVAAGALAGTYPLADGWYDIGRADALLVGMLACTYIAALRATTARGWVLCGASAAAAFTAKQPAVLAIAPLAVYLLCTDRRSMLWFTGTFAAIAGGVFVALNLASDGWYGYYVLELPRLRRAVSPGGMMIMTFWTSDVLPVLPALAAGGASLVLTKAWRHLALTAGLVGAAWISRLESGSWVNAAMPAYLATAILLGMLLRPTLPWPRARWMLAVVQLALLVFDPRALRPTVEDVAEGQAFLQQLRAMPGPVLVMNHGFWATQAGLPEHAHGWAVTDVIWSDPGETGLALEKEVRSAITNQRFRTIVFDGGRSWFHADLEKHYEFRRRVEAPTPLSGAAARPSIALAPR